MGNKDETLKCIKKKKRTFHDNRFTNFSEIAQHQIVPLQV